MCGNILDLRLALTYILCLTVPFFRTCVDEAGVRGALGPCLLNFMVGVVFLVVQVRPDDVGLNLCA